MNEVFYAPEGANIVLLNKDEYEWLEDEDKWLDGIFGTDIINESTKDDLQQIRQAVISVQQRRLHTTQVYRNRIHLFRCKSSKIRWSKRGGYDRGV